MAKELILESRLDTAAAEGLRAIFIEAQGDDITLDASRVTMLGGLCLEVILLAQHHWNRAGKSFAVTGLSNAFEESLALFGLDATSMTEGAP